MVLHHLLLFPATALTLCWHSVALHGCKPASSRRWGGSGEASAASACGLRGCCGAGPDPEAAVRAWQGQGTSGKDAVIQQ